jgi:hypothetical protein
MKLFACQSLLQHCDGKGNEHHTATNSYLRTLFKKGMGLTQAAVHQGKNDQSREAVDANEQISGRYYQRVDSQESDHVNKVNKNVENKAEWYGACIRGTKTYIFNPTLRLVLYQFLHTVGSCHHKTIHYTQQTATNTATMVAELLAPPGTRI